MVDINKTINKIKNFVQKIVRQKTIKTIYSFESQDSFQKLIAFESESIPTPEAKYISFPSWRKNLRTSTYTLPKIYTISLRNTIYYSRYNAVFTNARELILDSVPHINVTDKFSLRTLYFSNPEKLTGIYSLFRASTAPNNYYHSLIDYIPRIYLLNQPEYHNIESIKLLFDGELTKVEKFILPKILPDNITLMPVNTNKTYQLEMLILPSFLSSIEAGYLPSAYIDYLLEKIAPSRSRNKVKRIYISRREIRCILNEEELLNFLVTYGFEKYCLEDLSMERQIELFYDAEFVVAPHGAGLANLIFSYQVKVLELFPTVNALPYYYFICKSRGHIYEYWTGDNQNKDDNFEINLTEVSQRFYNLIAR